MIEIIRQTIEQKLQTIDQTFKIEQVKSSIPHLQHIVSHYYNNTRYSTTLYITQQFIAISHNPGIPLSDPDCIAKAIKAITELLCSPKKCSNT